MEQHRGARGADRAARLPGVPRARLRAAVHGDGAARRAHRRARGAGAPPRTRRALVRKSVLDHGAGAGPHRGRRAAVLRRRVAARRHARRAGARVAERHRRDGRDPPARCRAVHARVRRGDARRPARLAARLQRAVTSRGRRTARRIRSRARAGAAARASGPPDAARRRRTRVGRRALQQPHLPRLRRDRGARLGDERDRRSAARPRLVAVRRRRAHQGLREHPPARLPVGSRDRAHVERCDRARTPTRSTTTCCSRACGSR